MNSINGLDINALLGDWLTGDRGQDLLYGSSASNVLEGGADEIWGGLGDDLILGDGELMQNSGTRQHRNPGW